MLAPAFPVAPAALAARWLDQSRRLRTFAPDDAGERFLQWIPA